MKSILMTWLSLMALLAMPVFGQVATGTPPMGSFGGGPFDIINLGNLNSHFAIPVRHKAGRQVPFVYDISYDSSIWTPTNVSGVIKWMPSSFGSYWGWQGLSSTSGSGSLTYSTTTNSGSCGQFGTNHWNSTQYSNFVYSDESGAHSFGGYFTVWISTDGPPGTCPPAGSQPATVSGIPAIDGSGFTLYALATASSLSQTMTSRTGTSFSGIGGQFNSIDANGNQLSTASGGVFTDTLGQTALTVAGAPPSNTTLSYTAPSGATAQYTVSYVSYTVKTNFGCGIGEYNVPGVYLVDRITLPDNSSYQFKYEETPGDNDPTHVTGRIATITLPSGGMIAYSYTGGNNGIVCADGSTAGLTRTLSPGGTWTYARNQVGGTHWTTTITDPDTTNNQSLIDFQQDSTTTYNFYEMQRKSYQGSVGGTLLLTTTDCYNGNLSCTPSSAVFSPITQVDTSTTVPGKSSASRVETSYNFYGLVTDRKQYDYGASTPTLDTATTYANLAGIADHPASVTETDSSGNVLAETTYTYDEGTPTSTSGTPQHTAPAGARGNLTTVSTFTSSAGRLTKHFSYYDTGTINQATDVNSAVTTYSYGTGSCGNSFPTSINMPISGLTTSMTWNCVGGVQTGTTDLNGHSTSVTYTDANYWRPAHSLDQASDQTNYSYKSPVKTEIYMTFNGTTSIADQLTMQDGFGRLLTSQKRQSQTSNNYDTVETTYDPLGRASTVTMPYQGTIYQLTSTAPVTTTTYDALNRVLKAQDANGGYVQHTYTGNDDLQISGPAPTGENLKERQMEYDGLGRLTSVCEVTQGTGHIPCGQTNGLNGYLTTYTYSFVTPNVKVSVNQSGQGRTYLYDLAGRLVSETNPENGTTLYDFDSAPDCSGNYAGDLVERKDAKGNISCYTYDSLHRVLSVNYSGPDSANSPAKNFVYDSATVNGVAMANAEGQLAEAYTGTSGSKTTDEGFVYSVLGQVVEVWEKTPHSSTYYHPTASYWNNGALKSVWISSLPTISYGADGEGRASTVSASSGQNPVTATSYNVSSQVTSVTYGSADSDSYGFDPNSGRVTQYKFNVSTQSVIGNTTWNPNGSLNQLAITNQLNAADTQTCNYSHDDLARIATANCGAIWNQSFSYDAFGNIDKTATVGISFLPTYSSSTNQIATLPGVTPTTDADGRMTYDGTHNYAWDAEGKMVTVDTTTLTHDALGRMVEKSVSGTITEFVYGPLGSKFAQMSGSTLQKAFVPLPTGTAVYTGTGLSYYRHTDHLGSSRFATTTTRTMYSSTAYAPFGEPYAQAGTTDLSFTGHDQDSVAGIHDTLLRKFVPVQGRWLSPDPAGLGAVDPTNPQSWNRYAYVNNNPLAMVDPFGDDGCYDGFGNSLAVSSEDCYSAGGAWLGAGQYVADGNIYQLQAQSSPVTTTGNIVDNNVVFTQSNNFAPVLLGAYSYSSLYSWQDPHFIQSVMNAGFPFPAALSTASSSSAPTAVMRVTRPPVTRQQASNLCDVATTLRNNGMQPLSGHPGDPMYSLDESTKSGNALLLFAMAVGARADYASCMDVYDKAYPGQ